MCSEPAVLFLVKIISSIIIKSGLDEVFACLLGQKQKDEEEIQILKCKVDALTQRLARKNTQVCESFEHERRNNLRIYGWPENKGEVTDDEVINIVAKIGVTLKKSDIDRSYRIGKPGRYNSANRSRPILMKLRSNMSKREIMANAYKLKGHAPKVFINEDLTNEQARIASATRKLVKRTLLAGTWIRDGIIYAKKRDGHVVLLTRKDHLDELMQLLNRKRKLNSLQTPVGGPIVPSGSRLSHPRTVPCARQALGVRLSTMADNSSSQPSDPVLPDSMVGPPAFSSTCQVDSVHGTTRADNSPSQQSGRLPHRSIDLQETSQLQSSRTDTERLSDRGVAHRGGSTERKTVVLSTAGTAGRPCASASSPGQREEQDDCAMCKTASWLGDTTSGDADLTEKKQEIMYMLGRDDALSPTKTGFGLLQNLGLAQWQQEKIWNRGTGPGGGHSSTRVYDTLEQLSAHNKNIGYIVHYFVQEKSKRLDIVKLIRNIHQECRYCDQLYRIHIPQTPT